MIPAISHSGKGQTIETVKRSVVPGVGGKDRKPWRIFRAAKLHSLILQWWIHVIIYLPKPIECKTKKVNLNVNYGLWRIMMCQDRVTDCNKCTWGWGTLRILMVKETGMGVVCRQGVYGNYTFRSVLLGT